MKKIKRRPEINEIWDIFYKKIDETKLVLQKDK
jgi:hypothetical protein